MTAKELWSSSESWLISFCKA